MSVRVQAELDRLKTQGVSLADMTAGEVAALVRACDRCDSPFSAINAEAAGFPVEVCEGVYLWRLTAGAVVWLDEYAARWWGSGTKAFFWALVYAMSHAREKDAFTRLVTEEDAYRAVKGAALNMPATEEEIVAAIDRLGGVSAEGPAKKNRTNPRAQTDWETLARQLEAGTGLPVEYWMWDTPSRELAKSHRAMVDMAVAAGGGKTQRMRDEIDAAVSALARLEASIIRRVRDERGKEAGNGK